MRPSLFIEFAITNRLFFGSVVITVVVSIVLHELAHGVAAIWQGDRTPIDRGHMTLNPIVHMGWLAVVMLAVAGIAWGAMPVNPYRFRSRWGDALVAVAGPVTNLILAAIALTAMCLWDRLSPTPLDEMANVARNFRYFLWVFGQVNLVLFAFNLIPVPPLDGSRILANFNRPYAQLVSNPHSQGPMIALFVVVFLTGGYLFVAADKVATWYHITLTGW